MRDQDVRAAEVDEKMLIMARDVLVSLAIPGRDRGVAVDVDRPGEPVAAS
jgi:hypothetical protein